MNADDVVRVALAAPSRVACAQIEALFATSSDVCVVGSAVSTALADLLDRVNPDVLLIDLGSETGEVLEHLVERVALPPTVLLTSSADSGRRLLHPGVRAVLRSPRGSASPGGPVAAQLVAAIKAVAAGLIVLDEQVAGIEPPSEAEPPGERDSVDPLTPREIEVLQLLAEGLPNKEIAMALEISEHTVKFHLSSIFSKLGATSRTEVVTIGIRRGLLMV